MSDTQTYRILASALALVAALGLGPAACRAQNDPAQRLAVLNLVNSADLQKREVAYLTDQIRGAARDVLPASQFVIMTRQNIMDLLGDRALVDCQGACAVQTGRNLGAAYVVAGEIYRIDGALRLTINLHDVATGNLLSFQTIPAADLRELETRIPAGTDQLLRLVVTGGPDIARDVPRDRIASKAKGRLPEDRLGLTFSWGLALPRGFRVPDHGNDYGGADRGPAYGVQVDHRIGRSSFAWTVAMAVINNDFDTGSIVTPPGGGPNLLLEGGRWTNLAVTAGLRYQARPLPWLLAYLEAMAGASWYGSPSFNITGSDAGETYSDEFGRESGGRGGCGSLGAGIVLSRGIFIGTRVIRVGGVKLHGTSHATTADVPLTVGLSMMEIVVYAGARVGI